MQMKKLLLLLFCLSVLLTGSCDSEKKEEIESPFGKYEYNELTSRYGLATKKDGYYEIIQWDKNWNLDSISVVKEGLTETRIFKKGKLIRIEKSKDPHSDPYYVKRFD
ncbi:hypothetical protein [Leptospira weilii]|uniref:hypothetical protein n=1 Tax=Leptospira weilii TaxID=28184 RepID=UPI00201B6743|nr:hypothetical protein [Leptospira weilii]